jgi:hypothetical protein
MDNLDSGERFDMEGRALPPNAAEHVEVIIELQPGVQPADDVHFGRAGLGRSLCGGDDLLHRHFVCAFFTALAVERTEFAGEGTNVGVIDVPVAIKERAVAVQLRILPMPNMSRLL